MPVEREQESLKKEKKLVVDTREISLTGSTIYKGAGFIDYNPDSLVGKKGLEIYSKMREDDQVKAVLTMKKYARLMTTWEVVPASEDAIDKEIADFVQTNLENLTGTFEDCLLNILSALDYGYSITEKIWYKIEKGKYAGRIGLKALKTREPFYYGFSSDEFGNLKENGIIYQGPLSTDLVKMSDLVLKSKTGTGYELPVDKFVIYSYNKEFSNWYGRSDLRAAYRSWWSKEVLIRFMNIYMERFGMPAHVAKLPKNISKLDREELKVILDRVQAKYSIIIPNDVELDLLQAAGGGENTYRTAIEMHNRFISRSILVPDLMGFNESGGGGAYALGKKHFDVFLWILQKLGRDVEETIVGEQIIKQLVDYNYSNVEDYPKFKFESITAEGTAVRASIVQLGVAGGFIDPTEEWIREYLALPKKDVNAVLGVTVPGLKGVGDTGVDRTGDVTGIGGDSLKDIGDRGGDLDLEIPGDEEGFKVSKDYIEACKLIRAKKYSELEYIDLNDVVPSESQEPLVDMYRVRSMAVVVQRGEELAPIEIDGDNCILNGHHRLKAYKLAGRDKIPYIRRKVVSLKMLSKKDFQKKDKLLEDKRFDYKIDFKRMESDLDEYEEETVDALSKVVLLQKEALLRSVDRKAIVENKDYSAVNSLQLRYVGDFKREIENRLIKLHLDSKLEAINEIAKASNGRVEVVSKFADLTIQPWIPVQPTEAIDFFNRKVFAKVVLESGIKKLIELATGKELKYYDAKAFAIAGIEKDAILKEAKLILLNGIKVVDTKGTMYALGKLFDDYLTTGEVIDDELITPHRLEVIVRTNFAEALNNGRRAMFENPLLEGFAPYWQYKAIMDDRVRPTHAEMHNRIYRSDNPVWDMIYPPNGFNCRCIVTPITKYEVEGLVEKGQGIELSDDEPLPDGFPDEGFGKYASTTKSIVITLENEDAGDVKKVLENTLVELKNRLVNVENALQGVNNTGLVKDAEILALRGDKQLLQSKLEKMSTDLALKSDSEKKLADMQFELDKLNRENSVLLSSIKALKEENTEVMKALGVTAETKNAVSNELAVQQATLQAKIDKLNLDLKDKDKVQIDAYWLRKQVDELTLKNSLLEDKLKELDKRRVDELGRMEVEKTLLNSRIEQLKGDLANYTAGTVDGKNGKIIPRGRRQSEIELIEKGDKDIVRCPYPNCGNADIILEYDDTRLGVAQYLCTHCYNSFKVTKNKEIYLFDKVLNKWHPQNAKILPDYMSGEIRT